MNAASSLSPEAVAGLVALAGLPGIGPGTLVACLEAGDPLAVWEAVRAGHPGRRPELAAIGRPRPGEDGDAVAARWRAMAAAAQRQDPAGLLADHRRAGRQVLVHGDPAYPARLRDDPAPPALLFAEGDLGLVGGPTVAIVGTRNATRLGRETAASLARELSGRGVSIVSGLALGIDGAAHQAVVAALGEGAGGECRGRPIGVVAAGLDRPYPRRHDILHRQVAGCGVLVSEVPLGSPPLRWRFPARNRIIAGLADALVVVESRSAGGSMITAAEALRRDVPVLAVPGHPRSPAAAGPLDLLFDGAAPVRDVEDVLVAIGLGGQRAVAPSASPTGSACSEVGRQVLEALQVGPRTFGEIVAATRLDLDVVAAELTALESHDAVIRVGGWYEAGVVS